MVEFDHGMDWKNLISCCFVVLQGLSLKALIEQGSCEPYVEADAMTSYLALLVVKTSHVLGLALEML